MNKPRKTEQTSISGSSLADLAQQIGIRLDNYKAHCQPKWRSLEVRRELQSLLKQIERV
jgi:hypothetical protein